MKGRGKHCEPISPILPFIILNFVSNCIKFRFSSSNSEKVL
jgi:hypothetical protein